MAAPWVISVDLTRWLGGSDPICSCLGLPLRSERLLVLSAGGDIDALSLVLTCSALSLENVIPS